MLRFTVLSICCLSCLHVSSLNAQLQDLSTEKPTDAKPLEFRVEYSSEGSEFLRNFDVGSVVPGEKLSLIVYLRNQSDKPIQFTNAVVSCSCIDAKVTKEKIEPGETTPIRLEFSGDTQPTSLDKQVAATLNVADTTTVRLQFHIFYSKLSGFKTKEYVHTVVMDDAPGLQKELFQIPLVVSKDVDFKKIKVRSSRELNFVSFSLDQIKTTMLLNCTFARNSIQIGRTRGEVTLSAPDCPDQTIGLLLEGVGVFSVYPSLALFTKDDSSDGKLDTKSCSFMLRIHGEDAKIPLESIKCNLLDGRALTVSEKKLADGVYRMRVTFDPTGFKEDEKKLDSSGDVYFKFQHRSRVVNVKHPFKVP